MTYTGPSGGLQEYANQIYHRANLGAPPVANAPEVKAKEDTHPTPCLLYSIVHAHYDVLLICALDEQSMLI